MWPRIIRRSIRSWPISRTALADLKPLTPRIPLISTVGQADGAAEFDADYWVVNLRNPVRFSQAVATAAETHTTFVEISPHPLLTHGIGETLASVSSRDQFAVTAAMKRGDDETLSVHEQLATIGVTGADGRRAVAASRFRPRRGCMPATGSRRSPPGRGCPMSTRCWVCTSNCPPATSMCGRPTSVSQTLPWLADHTIDGQAVVTAAGFAEMALAAAAQALGLTVVQVSALAVERPLILDAQTRVTTQLSLGPDVESR